MSSTPPGLKKKDHGVREMERALEEAGQRLVGRMARNVKPLAGIANRGDQRIEGMDTEMYIRNSILNPNGYTVEGYPEGTMPSSLKDELAKEELEAVIAYLLTLK